MHEMYVCLVSVSVLRIVGYWTMLTADDGITEMRWLNLIIIYYLTEDLDFFKAFFAVHTVQCVSPVISLRCGDIDQGMPWCGILKSGLITASKYRLPPCSCQ